MITYSAIYLGSAFLALLVTPVVMALARRIDAVDRPGVRTSRERPIPRIGGVAIFLAAMALIGSVIFLDNQIGEAFRASGLQLATLLISATLIFAVGLADDLRGLPARVKFLAEMVTAAALCIVGVRISTIELTSQWILPLGLWGVPVTMLWIVGITNAVNLSDSLDGLAAGVSAITCGVIAVLAVHSGQTVMAVFMLALLGSLCGFLFFNFDPAKIYMGDCGSLFVGFTIASASVMCMTTSAALVGLTLPALVLGIPIFETLLSMLRRFIERRTLFGRDRNHFQQRLLELGLRRRHVVIAIYLVTLLAAGTGLLMLISQDIKALVILGCMLVLIVLLFHAVGAARLNEVVEKLRDKCADSSCRRMEQAAFEHLQLRFRQARSSDQWWQAVSEAGDRMDFAWVSLKVTHSDGRIEQKIWRAARTPPHLPQIVTMTISLPPVNGDPRREFEIAICANGSLEAAGRRATFFSRLLDENEPPLAVARGS